jgi:phosphoribosyl-AMP cyclohydrolase
MEHAYFKNLETYSSETALALTEVINQLVFDINGLIPVVTQDSESKDVLMFAWMNKQAFLQTISTRRMTYWSRSRQKLWVKGETSGHSQILACMSIDCDGDAVLCQVQQSGSACHTNRSSCFYLIVDDVHQQVIVR